MRTGLGVGQGVMMVRQVEAACCGNRLQLMIWEAVAETAPRGGEGVVEAIVRIIHLIHLERGFQATFVETAVVCHKRQPLDKGGYLLPNIGEYRCPVGILRTEPVHPPAEPLVVFRLRMYQAVVGIDNLPSADDDNPHAAYAGGLLVRRFEIYGCKICHRACRMVPYANIRKLKDNTQIPCAYTAQK